jgi:acetylornithine/N-succinyldiaminopimelate aminotransferase
VTAVSVAGTVPAEELARLRFGRSMHLDHYGGGLPFAAVGADGIRQRFVELAGERSGRTVEVLDVSGGYGSACLGAGHPVPVRAVQRAAAEAGYVTDEVGSLERARLLEYLFDTGGLLADHFPAGEYHACGRNSGSEGMELALRLVLETRFDRRRLRPVPGRAGRDIILAFEGAWHGWTSGLVPLLNRRHYRVGLPAWAPGGEFGVQVRHIPFGVPELAAGFFAEHGDRVLAVVVEPVQGDAGILVPPPGYLRALAGLCREHGALLVADEVLTFAKTGRFLAMADEQGPVATDVSVIGKSLGMGMLSTSMVIARRELTVRSCGAVATSDLRPLTCAVIREGLAHVVGQDLLGHSLALGTELAGRLRRRLVPAYPELFSEVRGLGVMHGVELTEAAAARLPELRTALVRAGVYTEFMAGAGRRSAGLRYVYPTMRIAPPLVTTHAEVAEVVDRLVAGSAAFLDGAG